MAGFVVVWPGFELDFGIGFFGGIFGEGEYT
jgi:hypothetical protein